MDGKVLSTLGAGKAKGINIVTWSYRTKQPKTAKGKTFSFGGFTSPRVPAGKYKAVITKGKDTFEHEFEVVYDERTGLSEADRKLKHDTTMKLYNMTEELAYMVYEVDAYIEATADNKKVNDQLNELKESLVITTGDNYVGLSEPQLREKMADLYSKVAGGYDRPSASELENLRMIEDRFEQAKADFDKLRKKAKVKELELQTFEEFIAS